MHMPQPNGKLWRRCRAKMDITSNQAAQLLGITGGALRQIETNTKPVSLALAFRAERLYNVPVDDLIVEDDGPRAAAAETPAGENPQPSDGAVAGAA